MKKTVSRREVELRIATAIGEQSDTQRKLLARLLRRAAPEDAGRTGSLSKIGGDEYVIRIGTSSANRETWWKLAELATFLGVLGENETLPRRR